MLEVQNLSVAYRGIPSLRDVSMEVPTGAVVALLGSNGAGKSTLLRAVSGTLALHKGAVTSGSVSWQGRRLTGRDTASIVRAGVVQVPEGRQIFTRLDVSENLRVGGVSASTAENREALDRVETLFPILAQRRRQRAGLLSGGEQQMLAIGRALMARPELLLLDEPSLGLAPRIVEQIAEVITEINQQGVSVLLVEQNAAMALELSSRAHVLDVGRLTLSGSSAELRRSDDVRRLYLGEATERDHGAVEELEDLALAGARPTLTRWVR